MFFTQINFIWINVPQIALAYSENPNSICLRIQKLFKKQWRTFLKKSDISNSVYFSQTMTQMDQGYNYPRRISICKLMVLYTLSCLLHRHKCFIVFYCPMSLQSKLMRQSISSDSYHLVFLVYHQDWTHV